MTLAFQAYELKKLEEAQQLFSDLPASSTTQFYQGIIELELGNIDEATLFFKTVLKEEKQDFFIPANYYLGLIDLKKNIKSEQTVTYFKAVKAATAYPYLQKKSAEILAEIE